MCSDNKSHLEAANVPRKDAKPEGTPKTPVNALIFCFRRRITDNKAESTLLLFSWFALLQLKAMAGEKRIRRKSNSNRVEPA
jgi:hypothetical protein